MGIRWSCWVEAATCSYGEMVKYKRTPDLLSLTLPTTRLPSDLKYYSGGTPLAFQDYLRSMFLSHRDFKGAGTYRGLVIHAKNTPKKEESWAFHIYDLWFTFRLQINWMQRCSHAFAWATKTIKYVSHFEAIWFRECSLVTIRVDEIHLFQTQRPRFLESFTGTRLAAIPRLVPLMNRWVLLDQRWVLY